MLKRRGKSLKLSRINKFWAIVFAALVISAPAFGADTDPPVSPAAGAGGGGRGGAGGGPGYFMGMKVAAVSVLCQDSRVFDGMWMAGTPCPYKGKIGEEAKQAWLDDLELIPEGASVIKEKIEEEEKEPPLEEELGE